MSRSHVLLAPVILANTGQTSEQLLVLLQRIGENHEKTSNDRKVSEEE